MRLLIEVAREQPFAELTPSQFHTLQSAVLGAHSALEDPQGAPTTEAMVAYEPQASSFFKRPLLLEAMVRSEEFLRRVRDEQLFGPDNHVPVDEWLRASGVTPETQRVLGFGLSAVTNTLVTEPPTPRIEARHLGGCSPTLGLPQTPRDMPIISASRAEPQASFEVLDDGDAAPSWEFRPFKSMPFLWSASGNLLLLRMPWILSGSATGFDTGRCR